MLPTSALAQQAFVPRFIVGKWYWAGCKTETPGGLSIDAGGRIVGKEGDWGCVITKMTENAPHFMDPGPTWDFTARCEQPADGAKGPGAFLGNISGSIRLNYRASDGRPGQSLQVWVSRPSKPGETGLLSMYPSELYGPYERCG
jgi:hypothetical protein